MAKCRATSWLNLERAPLVAFAAGMMLLGCLGRASGPRTAACGDPTTCEGYGRHEPWIQDHAAMAALRRTQDPVTELNRLVAHFGQTAEGNQDLEGSFAAQAARTFEWRPEEHSTGEP